MSKSNRRRGRRQSSAPCSSAFNPYTGHADRKLAQLCRQIHERIDLVLAGELFNPLLEDLWVLDVTPEPGSSAVLVTLVAPDELDLAASQAALDAARGRLRAEVAAAINRKRTPHLRLVVIPQRALSLDGGDS